eukprot:1659419-Pyramimonas_sp.AAC.1
MERMHTRGQRGMSDAGRGQTRKSKMRPLVRCPQHRLSGRTFPLRLDSVLTLPQRLRPHPAPHSTLLAPMPLSPLLPTSLPPPLGSGETGDKGRVSESTFEADSPGACSRCPTPPISLSPRSSDLKTSSCLYVYDRRGLPGPSTIPKR